MIVVAKLSPQTGHRLLRASALFFLLVAAGSEGAGGGPGESLVVISIQLKRVHTVRVMLVFGFQ